jgi:hypothetical protein
VTLPLLVLLSAIQVTLWLAAGLWSGIPWVTEVALAMTTVQGVAAGLVLPRFWHEKPSRAIFGAGGRFVGFELAVVFSAAEAHAVGTGFGTGAPFLGALMLAPPVVLAAFALRGAVRKERDERTEIEGERDGR